VETRRASRRACARDTLVCAADVSLPLPLPLPLSLSLSLSLARQKPARNTEGTPGATSRSGPADRAVTPKISAVRETNTRGGEEGKGWPVPRRLRERREGEKEGERGGREMRMPFLARSPELVLVVVRSSHRPRHRGPPEVSWKRSLSLSLSLSLPPAVHRRKARYRGWMYWVSRKRISTRAETGRPLPDGETRERECARALS